MRIKFLIELSLFLFSFITHAETCPDPNLSSLRQGVIPSPWEVSPASQHMPQGEAGAKFVRANILVIGRIGRGIVCTYQNSVGYYSIWQQRNVKVPARTDYAWRDTLSGFECDGGVEVCAFY